MNEAVCLEQRNGIRGSFQWKGNEALMRLVSRPTLGRLRFLIDSLGELVLLFRENGDLPVAKSRGKNPSMWKSLEENGEMTPIRTPIYGGFYGRRKKNELKRQRHKETYPTAARNRRHVVSVPGGGHST